MELLTPSIGLITWTFIVFIVLYFALKKLTWPLILNAVKQRENDIAESIADAKKMKEEMAMAKQEQEMFLAQARKEREAIIKEARDISMRIIADAKIEAKIRCEQFIDTALTSIQQQKEASLAEALIQVKGLALEAGEKLLQRSLSPETESEYAEFINNKK